MKGRRQHSRPGFRRRQARGQSIPLIALIIVVLFGMVGLAVDVGNTHAQQRRIVSATNAASIAGMHAYLQGYSDADIKRVVESSFTSNGINVTDRNAADFRELKGYYLGGDGQQLPGCSHIGCGSAPENAKFIQLEVDGQVDTFFARVMNQNTLPVGTTSIATRCPPGSSVYPIAVNIDTLDGEDFIDPNPDQATGEWGVMTGALKNYTWRRLYVHTTSSEGDFGWLRWTSQGGDEDDLSIMLTGDGNLDEGFEEVTPWPVSNPPEPEVYPDKPYQLNSGDWVHGNDPFTGRGGVADRLDGHKLQNDKGTVLILPIFSHATSEGGKDAKYLVTGLGSFALKGYGEDELGRPYLDLVSLGAFDHAAACTIEAIYPTTTSLTGNVSFKPEYNTSRTAGRPIRYVVVLDVSGSMNFSFDGRGEKDGTSAQCGNSPDPEKDKNRASCQPNYAWAWELEQRRIYVARQAVSHLIGLINIPGNDDYDDSIPMDQMRFVAFEKRVKGTTEWSSDKTTLLSSAKTVGQRTEYTTDGGTNGAAGLYQASLFLSENNTVQGSDGKTYEYKTVVIFVTDGVSNFFLMKELASQGYGIMANTAPAQFPYSKHCATMDQKYIAEAAECHINESAGGPYTHTDGKVYDRPITAMMETARENLHANGHEVHVVALSSIPDTGLKYGVASFPSYYAEAKSLEKDPETGLNNVDLIFQNIYEKVQYDPCIAKADPVTYEMDLAGVPDGFPEGQVGVAYLYGDDGEVFETPVVIDAEGYMSYTFSSIPEGNYTLRAYIRFIHPGDGTERQYDIIFDPSDASAKTGIPVMVKKTSKDFGGMQKQDISLRLDGDVCKTSGPSE